VVLHWRAAVFAVVTMVAASGCGGGATGVQPPAAAVCGGAGAAGTLASTGSGPSPGFGTVSGFVTNTRGGPPVSGAQIAASPSGLATTTDSQGGYALPLASGTYDIMASKLGMAASKQQSIVATSGQTTTSNLIMREVFDPTKPVAVPTISVTGLAEGQEVTGGDILFTVDVTASNPVRLIEIRTGHMDALPDDFREDSSSGNFALRSGALANGPAFIDIIAYDLNNNVAEWVFDILVNQSTTASYPPNAPTGLTITAVTTGQSLGLFTSKRSGVFSTLQIKRDPGLLSLPGRRSINLMAAPSNATLFIETAWNPGFGAALYKVYRSFNPVGPFTQIAEVTSTVYDDADPTLSPGVTVNYQVSAVNTAGETRTSALGVTPLSAFNVLLSSPGDNAVGVSTIPTFAWSFSPAGAAQHCYDISVQGVTDTAASWTTSDFLILNQNSVTYGTGGTLLAPALQKAKAYQWDIYQALGITVYSPNSVAVSLANGGGLLGTPTGSLNGPFTFTTTAE